MSGDKSIPDFDWLKQGIAGQGTSPANPPAPLFPSQSPPPEQPPAEQTAEPTPDPAVEASHEVSALHEEDMETLPPVVMNASDGSTLILRNQDFAEENLLEEPPPPAGFQPSAEEFAAPAEEPSDLLSGSDPSSAPSSPDAVPDLPEPAPGLSVTDAADAETSEPETVQEAEPVEPESPLPESSAENVEGELEPDPSSEESPSPVERDTDVARSATTSEFPVGAGRWPDFAAGVAAAGQASSAMVFGHNDADSPSAPSPKAKEAPPAKPGVSSRTLILLLSYASVMTLAFLLMLIKDLTETFRPHHLESLPDIPSEKEENLSYVPANMKLPPGHTVELGHQQRFGNILVEPVKITLEPTEFVHYTGDSKRKKAPTPPAWKLWLKLTNVSESQTIAPLDRRLVLRWITKARQNWDFTNQYITEQGAKSRNAPTVQLYRLPTQGDWDLKDQALGKELKPGESYLTYLISSDEGLESLGDELVWRVQLRKGYSTKGHGVTTIFEVPFRKEQVAAGES